MTHSELHYFSMTTLENMLVDLGVQEIEHRRDGHPIDEIQHLQKGIQQVLDEKVKG